MKNIVHTCVNCHTKMTTNQTHHQYTKSWRNNMLDGEEILDIKQLTYHLQQETRNIHYYATKDTICGVILLKKFPIFMILIDLDDQLGHEHYRIRYFVENNHEPVLEKSYKKLGSLMGRLIEENMKEYGEKYIAEQL